MSGTASNRSGRLLRALLLVLCLLAIAPAAAEAHAVLEGTTPERSADVKRQPKQVVFRFNEPVETEFGSVRVFDSSGEEVQSGGVLRPGGEGNEVAVALQPDLPDGTYTATYRVVSADSHPVAGGFVFSIGEADRGGPSVAELLGDQSGPGTDSIVFVIDRWLGYAATAILVGGLLFLLAAWRPAIAAARAGEPDLDAASDGFRDRTRRLTGTAAIVGALAALLALPIQGATAAGVSFADGFDPDLISQVLDTRFGTLTAVRAAAWIVLAVLIFAAPARSWSRPRLIAGAAAVPVAALLVAPGLAGHASTQDPTALLLPTDVVHISAMAIWLGGLAAFVFTVPAATRRIPAERRTALISACLGRFSPLALASVIALAATGTIQAIVEVGSFPALIDSGFGRTVLLKVLLLVLLIGIGWFNRNRLMPAIRSLAVAGDRLGRLGRSLRRNLRLEIGLVATVLAASALLVGYAPPSESAAGPVSGTATVGDDYLEYTIEPATVGGNQVHLYLFDRSDGSQVDPREVTATASLPEHDVGPLDLDLRRAGPGHYTTNDAQLGIAGDWRIDVEIRTSRFDAEDAEITVPID